MSDTKIEWAEKSWNPITGCSAISEGCTHCWARRMAKRLAGRYGYPKDDPFRVTFHFEKLDEPRKWRKPRRIFICSMGDLFHDDVQIYMLLQIFSIMQDLKEHTFLALTKRPENMLKWIKTCSCPNNLWLGVSVETQKRADERIPILLQIPAKVRFVSIEPMLGPVDLFNTIQSFRQRWTDLSWVILGGETGPGARPMQPDWARSVRDQCQEAGVPFFFKTWGDLRFTKPTDISGWVDASYDPYDKRGGRELDGRLWEEWPE